MEEEIDEGMLEERWLPVPDFEGWYDVSDFGRVRRVRAYKSTFVGKILKQRVSNSGYMQAFLCKNGKVKAMYAHRLVITSFVGPCPEGMEANHTDGNKTNNGLDNLEYVTHSENIQHAFNTGLRSLRGEKNNMSKLTEEDVRKIRKRLGKETQRVIAMDFNVSQQTISRIATGKLWGWVKEEEEE